MEDFRNIDLKNNMTLEPRLQEYLKKKSYFKKHNIDPSYNLEREHGITKDDKLRLRAFMRGDINCMDTPIQPTIEDTGFQIKHDDYKSDPRYEKLQKKIQRDRDANMSKYSYGNGPMITYMNSNNTNYTDDDYMKDTMRGQFLDSKPYMSDYSLNVGKKSNRVYDNFPAKIQYKNYLPWEQDVVHDNEMNDIIQKLDKYKNDMIHSYPEDMDNVNKSYSKSEFKNNSNASVPMRGSGVNRIGGTRDVDVENCLMKGLPERDAKFKSLGYPNYSEHSFDYISNDIQDPKHVVLPFPRGGDVTRLENNFKRSKPYYREIV